MCYRRSESSSVSNLSSDGVALPVNICLGNIISISIVSPARLHVNAIAQAPTSSKEIQSAKSELEDPMSRAFENSTLEHCRKRGNTHAVRELSSRFFLVYFRGRPLYPPLSRPSLSQTTCERSIKLRIARTPAPQESLVNALVHDMPEWGLTEKRPIIVLGLVQSQQ